MTTQASEQRENAKGEAVGYLGQLDKCSPPKIADNTASQDSPSRSGE